MKKKIPAVFRFQARLRTQAGNGKGAPMMLLDFPTAIGKQVRGMETIEGTIDGHPFRATLESSAPGGHWIRVNDAMRRGAKAKAGDTVNLAILGPEPEPVMFEDLRRAIASAKEAKALWNDLSTLARHDWLRWIDGAKKPETRARRVMRTVEQLSEGKRRPCCVNFYEFMLARVNE